MTPTLLHTRVPQETFLTLAYCAAMGSSFIHVPKGSIVWKYICFIQSFTFCNKQGQEMEKLNTHEMSRLPSIHYCQSVPSLQKPQVMTYRVSPPPRTSDSLWQCRRMFMITWNFLSTFKAVNSFTSASTMKWRPAKKTAGSNCHAANSPISI